MSADIEQQLDSILSCAVKGTVTAAGATIIVHSDCRSLLSQLLLPLLLLLLLLLLLQLLQQMLATTTAPPAPPHRPLQRLTVAALLASHILQFCTMQ
jgi:hypothetical protein